MTRRVTPACPTPRVITSVACCTTRRRCWPSPPRRRTPTSAWSPASRPRSTWSTASATGRRVCVSRSPAPTRRPSGWSSVAPTRRATPYLAFAAMLMAGLDGIKKKIEPQTPVDKDLYELPPEEAANIPQAPTQLSAVIDRLEEDHEYLTEGGVFTSDLVETWINFKRDNEILPVQIRPHPYEFALYYDV